MDRLKGMDSVPILKLNVRLMAFPLSHKLYI